MYCSFMKTCQQKLVNACAVLYKLLVKAHVLPADCCAMELRPIWFRCQALFIRFIEAAMKATDNV